MNVTILGAGSIAFGMAALLCEAGHAVTLWSPSGKGTAGLTGTPLTATGAVSGAFPVAVAATPESALAQAEIAIIAVPGYAHRAVMEATTPHFHAGQAVIISSHCSLSALYLARLLAARDLQLPIAALGTTMVSGRTTGPASVNVTNVRQRVDVATLPAALAPQGLAACQALFGDSFEPRTDLLAIALSNLNPQNHMAMALCNMTRIENGETWGNYAGITGTVGRLMETLDLERLALAAALDVKVRSIQDHFHLSFAVPHASMAEMAAAIHARGNAPNGPASLDTRYVHEDVPFGLVPTEAIARIAQIPTPLHTAGINLFSALYGIDFRTQNNLLPALAIESMTPEQLKAACH